MKANWRLDRIKIPGEARQPTSRTKVNKVLNFAQNWSQDRQRQGEVKGTQIRKKEERQKGYDLLSIGAHGSAKLDHGRSFTKGLWSVRS